MKPPKSLYNLQGPEQIRAFKKEMFMYPVTREGIFPQRAEAALKQALIELREQMSNQKSLQEKFLKDKTTLQGFDKDFLGDKNVETSEYHKVLSIDTDYAIVYFNEGYEKSLFFDCEGALADYSKAIQIDPNFADAYYGSFLFKGIVKYELGDYIGAIADYSKAIEIDPFNTQLYISRGCTKTELGDYRGAIEDFDKIIEMDPDYSYAYYNRGNAKQKLGLINGACLDWNKAVELGHKWAHEMIKNYCK
jgi:tetratricopeptide (TPR) repeat protein